MDQVLLGVSPRLLFVGLCFTPIFNPQITTIRGIFAARVAVHGYVRDVFFSFHYVKVERYPKSTVLSSAVLKAAILFCPTQGLLIG